MITAIEQYANVRERDITNFFKMNVPEIQFVELESCGM